MILTLLSFTALLFLLPFLPALVELAKRRDANPLTIHETYDHDLRYSPQTFGAYVQQTLRPHVRQCVQLQQSARKPLTDGTTLHLLVETDEIFLKRRLQTADLACDFICFSLQARLPAGLIFGRETFAAARLHAGAATRFDSLFADEDVHLDAGAVVERWLHAGGTVSVESGAALHGSVSAGRMLSIKDDCAFERLNAPVIHLGTNKHYMMHRLYQHHQLMDEKTVQARQPFFPDAFHDRNEQRTLILGDLIIPPNHDVQGNFVVRGEVVIGEGARVLGSIKSHKYVLVEPKAHVHGGLFSNAHMVIGSDCTVTGLVVAERKLGIGEGAVLGRPQSPTSISARHIYVDPGVTVHGTIWALEKGWIGTKGLEPNAA